jgi:hypothetical protein
MKARRIVDALNKAGYLAFPDATADPRLENHDAKKAEGIASLLTVPVNMKDHTIGVLSLYTGTRREFEADEIDFLQALAEQGGIAIEKDPPAQSHAEADHAFSGSGLQHQLLPGHSGSTQQSDGKHLRHPGHEGVRSSAFWTKIGTLKLVASHGLSDEFLETGRHHHTETAARALKGETIVISDATTTSASTSTMP